MITKKHGTLHNNAGKENYINPISIDNVIEYITRTNGDPDEDLVTWGAVGAPEFLGVDTIIDEFHLTQKCYKRNGTFGRYLDHEWFSFTSETEKIICENNLDIDRIARDMACEIYDHDHCQVVYGVHYLPKRKHLHVHFAINTVNFKDGNKRRESMGDTSERNLRFNEIVEKHLEMNTTNPS